MKIFKAKFVLVILSLFIFFSTSSYGEALEINNWNIDAEILENGSLRVREDLIFNFKDSFNGVFRDLDLSGQDIENIKIYQIIDGKALPLKEIKGSPKDNEYEILYEDSTIFKIYSKSKDENKTFRLEYDLKNIVTNYRDLADFNHKFIGESNSTPVKNLRIKIYTPDKKLDGLKIFGHGYKQAKINFADDYIKVTAKDLPASTMIETRLLLDPLSLPANRNIVDENRMDKILDEEEKLAEVEKSRGQPSSIQILILLGLLSLTGILFKLDKRDPYDLDKYKKQDFLNLAPAVVSLLNFPAPSLSTVLLSLYDLADRGLIDMENQGKYKSDSLGEELENICLIKKDRDLVLLGHEKLLMDFLFNDLSKGQLTTEEIYNYQLKNPLKFQNFFTAYIKALDDDMKKMDLKDRRHIASGSFICLISIAGLIVSLIFGLRGSLVIMALSLALAVFNFILAILLANRASDKGYAIKIYFKELKKDIKSGHKNIDNPRILIYATSLGLSFGLLSKFKKNFDYDQQSWLYWFFRPGLYGQNALTSSISSGTTSSGLGGGGSFTSGGGGGTGGGGAGGF